MLSSKRYRWQNNVKIVSMSANAAGFQKEGKPRDTMRLMQLRFTDVLPPHHGSEKVRKYPLYHSSSGVYSGLISYVDHISTREMGGGEGSEFIGRVFFDSSRVVPTAQDIRLVNRAVLYREPSYLKTQEGRQVREHLPSHCAGSFLGLPQR